VSVILRWKCFFYKYEESIYEKSYLVIKDEPLSDRWFFKYRDDVGDLSREEEKEEKMSESPQLHTV